MRDNHQTAVKRATDRNIALMDELADLRIEKVARTRRATPAKDYVSLEDMKAFVDGL